MARLPVDALAEELRKTDMLLEFADIGMAYFGHLPSGPLFW